MTLRKGKRFNHGAGKEVSVLMTLRNGKRFNHGAGKEVSVTYNLHETVFNKLISSLKDDDFFFSIIGTLALALDYILCLQNITLCISQNNILCSFNLIFTKK